MLCKKGYLIRALRLPFLSVSILPFIFGSFLCGDIFLLLPFFLGIISVISTHLAANLLNDYADSKSGADWQDNNFYSFFGGSKLIQEGVFSEGFYLKASLIFFLIAFLSTVSLAAALGEPSLLFYFSGIIFLGWAYSCLPFRLSYRRLGELVIFLLFGPALVMGGYFIQNKIFPDLKSFLLSLPFGFFTTAILFANEIPDYPDDRKTGKMNWVSVLGPKNSFLLYIILLALGYLSIILGVVFGYLGNFALLSLVLVFPGMKAAGILRDHAGGKIRFRESSKLTILLHTMAGIILILSLFL
ncbi:MAG: prenyltransferase [Candidatus Omnitrophota bacterium]